MTKIDASTAAIAALMDGVTAGPWEQDGPISAKIVWAGPDVRVCFMTSDGPASKNARFIAAARELVPALTDERDAAVARAERAEARVAELEAEVERMRGQFAAGWKAAIEAAADFIESAPHEWRRSVDAHAIRSVPMPTDAAAALNHLTEQARAQGMREAAEAAKKSREWVIHSGQCSYIDGIAKGHDRAESAIRARAEEIEKEARNG